MLNVQNPDNQQVHSQGFYESLIVKKKTEKTFVLENNQKRNDLWNCVYIYQRNV